MKRMSVWKNRPGSHPEVDVDMCTDVCTFLKSLLPINLLFSSTTGKIDDQIFINKNTSAPGVLRFHPYEPYLAVADRGGVRYAFFCACHGWG